MDESINLIVKQELLKISNDLEIVLFGSRSRGGFHKESDWDFLILSKDDLSKSVKNKIRNKLYDIELHTGKVIGSIIQSKKNWDNIKGSPIYTNVTSEGVKI